MGHGWRSLFFLLAYLAVNGDGTKMSFRYSDTSSANKMHIVDFHMLSGRSIKLAGMLYCIL